MEDRKKEFQKAIHRHNQKNAKPEMKVSIEEGYIESLMRQIEDQYEDNPTGGGCSFGEILCWEIHTNGLTFIWLAEKWGISVSALGMLIADHCNRLEPILKVNHDYKRD